MKVKVIQKVKIIFLAITFVLFVIQTSNLSHTVAHGKVSKFVTFKVKGHCHIKGQNNNFSPNFVLFVIQTSNLSHAVAYGKANKILILFLAMTLVLFVVQISNLSHILAYGKVNLA